MEEHPVIDTSVRGLESGQVFSAFARPSKGRSMDTLPLQGESHFPRYMWPNMKLCPDNETTGHGHWIPCAPTTERTCPKCERSRNGSPVTKRN